MPELPEVEEASARLRAVVVGRTVLRARALHRSLQARVSRRTLASLRGARIARVERRGKHQLIHLDDGRTIHVHFRMSGDWAVLGDGPVPRSVRFVMELDDGSHVALVDPRALGTVDVHPRGTAPVLAIGPEASDPGIDPAAVHAQLAKRRGAIKPVLLDQALLAGVGNIYAAEACWHAKIDPRRPANDLTPAEVKRLLASVRAVLARATGARYADGARFAVYDREGEPCRRCRTPVARLVQAGRSTYFCPSCQALSRAPRAVRP